MWSKTYGQTRTKQNLIAACVKALLNLLQTKTQPEHLVKLNIVEGVMRHNENDGKEGESS